MIRLILIKQRKTLVFNKIFRLIVSGMCIVEKKSYALSLLCENFFLTTQLAYSADIKRHRET